MMVLHATSMLDGELHQGTRQLVTAHIEDLRPRL
ncbi:hypothetical protein HNR10_000406 [Nocardiopsis aegyptia]|uniref:Uncharacterized protein n=1 Tax=Nocardiopsis aegyptia TaxID=220378 RepID=A0A7Z0EI57_9ACTN|nr:hypothetical protein [Nocardiopsis aegyptia]